MVPQSLPILQSTTMEYHVYVLVAADNDMLHVINCYLPPNCPCTDSEAWAAVLHQLDNLLRKEPVILVGDFSAVLHQLDNLPTKEPVILVGDFNAHLGGLQGLEDTPCPLHGE